MNRDALESPSLSAYSPHMDYTPHSLDAPPDWLEAMAESEADLAAGRTVPAEVVHQRIRDCIARIEARRAADPKHKATERR